jgi:hypothetical protein
MIGPLLLVLAAAPEWKQHDPVDGIAIASREVPNERVVELRLTTTSKASVDALCTAGFGPKGLDPTEPDITLRRVLEEGAGWQVTYEQISPPIVNNRDYAVRSKKEVLPNGTCRVSFAAANELAPPLPRGFVRIEKLRGSWEFEPAGAQTRVTYVIFTDPGGSIPAAFIEGSRRKTAVAWVKLVLNRAAQK